MLNHIDEFLCQSAAALRRAGHGLRQSFIVLVELLPKERGTVYDGHEHIVDIMRNVPQHSGHFGKPGFLEKPLLRSPELLFGLLALDKLTDLDADISHHIENVFVRFTDLLTKKLNDSINALSFTHGKCTFSMEPGPRRHLGPSERRVRRDIGDADRLAGRPHATDESSASFKNAFLAVLHELRRRNSWRMPQIDKSQRLCLFIHTPKYAQFPAHALADGSQDCLTCLL
jgi:hypothetical protein